MGAGITVALVVVASAIYRSPNGFVAVAGIPVFILALVTGVATLVGAATAGTRHRSSGRMLRGGQRGSATASHVPAPTPRDGRAFEETVARLYEHDGYEVERTGRHGEGTDGGVDLVLRVPTATTGNPKLANDAGAEVLVQCKDYAKGWVSVDQVRAFFGAVCGWPRRPSRGVFVTTRFFSADARAFADANGVELVDGPALAARLAGVAMDVPFAVPEGGPSTPDSSGTGEPPLCPRCRVPMVLRRPGPADDWVAFWGCRNYAKCGCRETAKMRIPP
jgi:hypothetical protein